MPIMLLQHEAHLLGKILEAFDSEMMFAEGFTAGEAAAADELFERLDEYLTAALWADWWLEEVA